uniref:Uncharacterized protein n=1 Tax=Rhizophora mucronata TaxID=61149 RepID=A0A2P2PLX3_RHIMU
MGLAQFLLRTVYVSFFYFWVIK